MMVILCSANGSNQPVSYVCSNIKFQVILCWTRLFCTAQPSRLNLHGLMVILKTILSVLRCFMHCTVVNDYTDYTDTTVVIDYTEQPSFTLRWLWLYCTGPGYTGYNTVLALRSDGRVNHHHLRQHRCHLHQSIHLNKTFFNVYKKAKIYIIH